MTIQADNYKVIVRWSDEDEKYVATCPAFPFSVGGRTPEKAVWVARTLLEDMLEVYEANGDPLPKPDDKIA